MEDDFHRTRLKKALHRLHKRWGKELLGERSFRLKTLPEFCLVWVLQHLTEETKRAFGRVMRMFRQYIMAASKRLLLKETHCALLSVVCTKLSTMKGFREDARKIGVCIGQMPRLSKRLIYDRHLAVMRDYPEAIPLVRRLYPKCPHCIILSIYFPGNQ